MRNCGVAYGDLFITPPPPYGGPPPLSEEAINGISLNLQKTIKGSTERGAGKP